MAVYEKAGLQMMKDANGNKFLLYPITSLDCVEGAEDLLHYDAAQELTDEQKAQVRTNIGAIASAIPTLTEDGVLVFSAAGDTAVESTEEEV